MLHTILKLLPFGENVKVFIGVTLLCGLGYLPIAMRGQSAIGFDNIEEKREAMRHAGAATKGSG